MLKHDFEIFPYISCRISNSLTPVFTKNEFELSKMILGLWKFFFAKKKKIEKAIYAKNFVIFEKYHPDNDTSFYSFVPYKWQFPFWMD